MTCPNCSTPNPDTARFCMSCGAKLNPQPAIEGERKHASVLFADVVGSTSLAEGIDPEAWTEIMNGAFAIMNEAVTRFGGTVGRLMGDAVLAFFGAPVAQEDHAERAVRSGLAILEEAAGYGRRLASEHGLDFRIRVGISSGLVVFAKVGDHNLAEYTAMGDTANVAARLQGIAPPGGVLVAAETHLLTRHLFEVTPGGSVAVKGRARPVETYRVLGPKASPDKPRGLDGVASPLVGRDLELQALQERLSGLAEGRGAFAAVVGEAGLGKSRLLEELRARSGGPAAAPRWLEARSLSYGQEVSYHPWRQVVRQIAGLSANAEPAAVRERLGEAVLRLGVPTSELPLLETLLSAASEESSRILAHASGEALIAGVTGAVRQLLAAALRRQPLILVLEDFHWADRPSVELLVELADLVRDEPLLVVALLRPDRDSPGWSALGPLRGLIGDRFLELQLKPLDAGRAAEMLSNLLTLPGLPSGVRELILRKTDGNPFFLEEVIRSLIDSEYLVRDGTGWRVAGGDLPLQIPDTVFGVLASRIDRLSEETKRVAQTAAVIGRTFAQRTVAAVCGEAPEAERIPVVDPHLRTLAVEELVQESAREPELEYSFRHALAQEAAYDGLLLRRRKELHRRAGRVLERMLGEGGVEAAALLAHHFLLGEEWSSAARYSSLAAQQSMSLFAVAEALRHYGHALDALDRVPEAPPETFLDAVLGWSEVAVLTRRHEQLDARQDLLERLEGAEAVARKLDDRRRLARLLITKGNVLMLSGFPLQAFPVVAEANRLAAGVGDERLVLLPFFMNTERMVDQDPRRALQQFDQVIGMAREQGNKAIEVHALAVKAMAHARLGESAEARETIELALELAPRSGSVIKEADVNIVAGIVFFDLGESRRGLEHSLRGARQALSINGLQCACSGFYVTGYGRLLEHQLVEAEEAFREALQLGRSAGVEAYVNLARAGQALARLRATGEDVAADLELALANANELGDDYGAAFIRQELGGHLLERGQLGAALEHLGAALEYFRRAGMRPYLARALEPMAKALQAAGRTDEASAALAEASELRRELEGPGTAPLAASPALESEG